MPGGSPSCRKRSGLDPAFLRPLKTGMDTNADARKNHGQEDSAKLFQVTEAPGSIERGWLSKYEGRCAVAGAGAAGGGFFFSESAWKR